jgi:hypothetical protein
MRYESAVNSAGGDDVTVAQSFIIASEGPVLNWYSLLPPHSVYRRADLKTKFMQAFQMFQTQQLKYQICTTASRKTESHCGTS